MKYLKLCLFCLLLIGCSKKEVIYEDKSNDFLNIKENNIEVYEDINLLDIIEIKDSNLKIITSNYKIDTDKLGEKSIEVNYELDKKKYVYKNVINIVDTTPPLVFSGTTKTVEINYQKDLCNLITYGDNYSGNIACKIDGNYDLSKVGTYKLLYTLSDSSLNEKQVNVTLKVVNKIDKSTSTSTTKTLFKDIYNKHKKDNTEIGIDVSKWQEEIDFQKVKEAGATFVMMRLGVESNNQVSVDKYYKENIKKAKDAGLKVGVYFYSIATTIEEAKSQADFVIKTLDNEELDLPVVFDWESWENWNTFKISFHEINEIANAFLKRIEDKGYKGMLYSSKFYLETIWNNKENYPVWLAHYTKETDYKGDYIMWQLCNNGRISGINGDVDIDIMYNS